MTSVATTQIEWVVDSLRKDDIFYRCSIDGREYIRSCRTPKPPRVHKARTLKPRKPQKPRIMTPEERHKRKLYMLEYRRKRKSEVQRLQGEIIKLREMTTKMTST